MQTAVAVDACVLLDRAEDDDATIDAIDTIFRRVGVTEIGVPPTVVGELGTIYETGDEREKQLAGRALTSLLDWGFKPFNLVAVGHGIVDQIAWSLRSEGILPEEEVNDSLIISECALAGFRILVSADGHMIDAHRSGKLQQLLERFHVSPLLIVSPRAIVAQFFRRR